MSVSDLTKKFYEAKKNLTTEIVSEMLKELADVFTKYPKLESFSWEQWTPGFNDGDPCTFGVHADPDYNMDINGENAEEWDWKKTDEKDKWGGFKSILPDEDKWKDEAVHELAKFIYSIPNEVLESTYGEGRVTINKDGTSDTEDVYHD